MSEPRITDEQREALTAQLDQLGVARKQLEETMAPLRRALDALGDVECGRLEPLGVELRGRCESCLQAIVTGDRIFHYESGELLCIRCAPTWADLKAQTEAGIAAGA
jgi:hypothetical protein